MSSLVMAMAKAFLKILLKTARRGDIDARADVINLVEPHCVVLRASFYDTVYFKPRPALVLSWRQRRGLGPDVYALLTETFFLLYTHTRDRCGRCDR